MLLTTLTYAFSQGQVSEVGKRPIFEPKQAKHNVFGLFDDSASIQNDTVFVSEHFDGYGLPVCQKPSDWESIKRLPQYQDGNYYDPFAIGFYVPYDPLNKHTNYDGTIYIEKCLEINRGIAFKNFLKQFLYYFSQEYLLGFGSTGKDYTATLSLAVDQQNEYSVILGAVSDLSKNNTRWDQINAAIEKTFDINKMQNAWSPIFPALYNLSLYFRGHPIPVSMDHTTTGYKYKQYDSPLKYRCAKNEVVLFTDGKPNRSYVDVFAKSDAEKLPLNLASNLILAETKAWNNGQLVILNSYPSLYATDLSNYYQNPQTQFAYIQDGYTGSEDGLTYSDTSKLDRNRYDNAKYQIDSFIFQDWIKQDLLSGHNPHNKPSSDASNKAWQSNLSIPQEINIKGVIFSNKPSTQLLDVIKSTGGEYLSKQTFDTNRILEQIEMMISGTDERFTNGRAIEDQYYRTPDTIRYVFTNNINTNAGNILAYTLKKNGSGAEWSKVPEWSMNQRSYPLNGQFFTMNYANKTMGRLTKGNINKIYKEKYGEEVKDEYLHWLYGISVFNGTKNAQKAFHKPRHSIIGPVVNSSPAFFAKDREYINLNFVSSPLKAEFEEYVKEKSKQMKNELLVVNANDGMIHFVKTDRSDELSQGNGGVRAAAYFPGFLAARLKEIAELDKPFAYTMDGVVDIFEFKGKDGGIQAVGLSGMGGGGKGVVGYRLLKMQNKKIDNQITPLFELVNEDGFAENSKNFKNLGYTYSGFAFFNQADSERRGAGNGVGVFGNGVATKISSLYFIDLENGELLKEVVLNSEGGGASTPSLVLEKDNDTGFQKLKYAVVGDQSGRLYKVSFMGGNISSRADVEIMYDPSAQGLRLFDHPITVRPLIHEDPATKQEWVYVGTGRNIDRTLDRGEQSKLQQYFIASPIRDDIHLENMKEVRYSVVSNTVRLLNSIDGSASNGWYLKLAYTNADMGNRLVYEPGVTTNDDIVFSTWRIVEGDEDDYCSPDSAVGLQFALNAQTGNIGLFKSNGANVAGVEQIVVAPGLPSGSTITYKGYLGGNLDNGSISTLGEKTIDDIKNNVKGITSHGDNDKHLSKCLATTNGEINRKLVEFCHDFMGKSLQQKRLSIQRLY